MNTSRIEVHFPKLTDEQSGMLNPLINYFKKIHPDCLLLVYEDHPGESDFSVNMTHINFDFDSAIFQAVLDCDIEEFITNTIRIKEIEEEISEIEGEIDSLQTDMCNLEREKYNLLRNKR
jgi:hypothetical protein